MDQAKRNIHKKLKLIISITENMQIATDPENNLEIEGKNNYVSSTCYTLVIARLLIFNLTTNNKSTV